MKVSYNREEDILTIETAKGNVDHAEEMGSFIVHFTKDDKPVIIEILDASDFLSLVTKSSIKGQPIEVS